MVLKHPVLFIGHGNPMNALKDNAFTQTLRNLGESHARPRAILCISAHWMTKGTWITHMADPKTIHDFGGFPKELFEIQYPAPSDPALAESITRKVRAPELHLDSTSWGFDHGTWSVMRHMYPRADIPVLQLSLDLSEPPSYHYEVGQSLRFLRDEGVLIVGSGNIVHNLRRIRWEEDAKPYDWAIEFDTWVKNRASNHDFSALINDPLKSEAGRLSIPTPDHWLPLLYVLGAVEAGDSVRFEYEGIENASISMRCMSFTG